VTRFPWLVLIALILGLALGGSAVVAYQAVADAEKRLPFWGPHQSGITTAPQPVALLVAFDVVAHEKLVLTRIFRAWTLAASDLMRGVDLGDLDTGENLGYAPSRLSITFGVGTSFFDRRLGLAYPLPPELGHLPVFPGDKLQADQCNGDLVVQICGDDPTTVYGAYHNLAHLAEGVLTVRWTQSGFQSSPAVSKRKDGRNLQGFHDGTHNLDPTDPASLAQNVWVSDPGAPWLTGGTYLVVRRIQMLVEPWESVSVADKERIVGRTRAEGKLTDSASRESHVNLARGEGKQTIFRRPYSFFNGYDRDTKSNDAGLLFVSFQKSVLGQFLPILKRLAEADPLNQYTRTTGSAVFAILPGVEPGHYLGQELLEGRP